MFKLLRQNKGQGISVQYSTTFFLVVAVVASMTIYIKRGLQARIHDARNYIFMTVNEVYSNSSINIVGDLRYEYEPYYANRETIQSIDSIRKDYLFESLPTATSGVYLQELDQTTSVRDKSSQAPPSAAEE